MTEHYEEDIEAKSFELWLEDLAEDEADERAGIAQRQREWEESYE